MYSYLLLALGFVVVFMHVIPTSADGKTTEQARQSVADHEKRLQKPQALSLTGNRRR